MSNTMWSFRVLACALFACALTHRGGENALLRSATPLQPSVSAAVAAAAVRRDGVARIDGVLDVATAAALKAHVTQLCAAAPDAVTQRWAAWMGAGDARYVPGTRIRFGEALERPMDARRERVDVLLPLEDAVVADALRRAVSSLHACLRDASAALPEQFAGENGDLELVECGALISHCGAPHQRLHADFRRDELESSSSSLSSSSSASSSSNGAMPPRLVVFVYLQDAPSASHGATVFVPGSCTARAHARTLNPDSTARVAALGALFESVPVVCATLDAGDAVIYDASVLHFGGANSVPDNERSVFYFGVSKCGAAARCAPDGGAQIRDGREAVPPVALADWYDASC